MTSRTTAWACLRLAVRNYGEYRGRVSVDQGSGIAVVRGPLSGTIRHPLPACGFDEERPYMVDS